MPLKLENKKHEIFQNFLKEKCQDKTISSPCIST